MYLQFCLFQLKESQKVVMFKLQFWDCGEHAVRKYDHILPVRIKILERTLNLNNIHMK